LSDITACVTPQCLLSLVCAFRLSSQLALSLALGGLLLISTGALVLRKRRSAHAPD